MRHCQGEHGDGGAAEISVGVLLDGLPALTQEVTQADETGRPEGGPAIGKEAELVWLHCAHARGVRREMAHPGNEISERKTPVADARKPGVRGVDVLFGDAQIFAVTVD